MVSDTVDGAFRLEPVEKRGLLFLVREEKVGGRGRGFANRRCWRLLAAMLAL